jgi:hypothetical protein
MQCKNLHPLASTQPQLRRWQPWLLAGCFLSTSVTGLEGADPLASSTGRSHPITDAIGIQFLSSQPMSLLSKPKKQGDLADSGINFRIHDEAVVDRKAQAMRPVAAPAPLAPPRSLNIAPPSTPATAPSLPPTQPTALAASETKEAEDRSADRLAQRQPERYRPKAMVVSVESKDPSTGKTDSSGGKDGPRAVRPPAVAAPPAPTTTAPSLVADAEQLQRSIDRVAADAASVAAPPLATEDPLMKALRQVAGSYTEPPATSRTNSAAPQTPSFPAREAKESLSPAPTGRSLPELAKLEPATAPAGLPTESAKKTEGEATGSGIELSEAAPEPEIEWNKYPAALQTLRMAPREVRNLRLNRPVARLEIVRKNKVQAVLRSPMDLTLLGIQEGTTLIVFHPVDPQAAPWSLAFQVGRPGFAPGSSTTDLELVQQSIQACYPNSDVKLRQGEQGELVVEGTVANESVARDILSMVRQLCLVPVQDEIVSQSK